MKTITFDSEMIENMIVGALVNALLNQGYQAHFSDQDGGGTFVYVSNDGHKPRGGFKHWVRLMPGNGADVISDYTTSLEETIKPANDLAAQFQQ